MIELIRKRVPRGENEGQYSPLKKLYPRKRTNVPYFRVPFQKEGKVYSLPSAISFRGYSLYSFFLGSTPPDMDIQNSHV